MEFKSLIVGVVVYAGLTVSASATTLQESVRTAIQTNPDVLAVVNERNAVATEVEQARAGYKPTVDLAIGTGWEVTDNPSTRGQGRGEVHLNRDEASLNLSQMIFDGSQTTNEVRRHTARTDARAYSVFGAAENTALETVDAYLEVLRRQELVALASTNLEAHERTHDQIKLRSERGVGRKSDMEQSAGRVALAKSNLISEESNLRDAETDYIRVVGIAPESLESPDSPEANLPADLDEALSLAISNHPTLKSAKADVESANAQHDTANAPFYPRLDFELGVTVNNDIDGIEDTNKDVTAMFRLRYNLFNGGADKARREETAYLINQSAEIRNNTYRQVEQSTRLSWNAMETVNSQMEFFREHALASENSRNAYQQQFNLGQRSLLDLLDSENEVFSSNQSLVNAEYDQLVAMYRVLNSMGLLTQDLDVALPEASIASTEYE